MTGADLDRKWDELLKTPTVRASLWVMTSFSEDELIEVMDAVNQIDKRRRSFTPKVPAKPPRPDWRVIPGGGK